MSRWSDKTASRPAFVRFTMHRILRWILNRARKRPINQLRFARSGSRAHSREEFRKSNFGRDRYWLTCTSEDSARSPRRAAPFSSLLPRSTLILPCSISFVREKRIVADLSLHCTRISTERETSPRVSFSGVEMTLSIYPLACFPALAVLTFAHAINFSSNTVRLD